MRSCSGRSTGCAPSIDYRAEVGCSPNFGYDLCVSRYRADQMQGIDLSSWKVALNGAEPVHAETIERFIETFAGHGFDPATPPSRPMAWRKRPC